MDFRKSILFTSLTPCVVCCAQICHRCHFEAVVIGDITNAPSSEAALRAGGIGNVKVIEDARAVALYREYLQARPEQHFLEWGGHRKLDEAIARGLGPDGWDAPDDRGGVAGSLEKETDELTLRADEG